MAKPYSKFWANHHELMGRLSFIIFSIALPISGIIFHNDSELIGIVLMFIGGIFTQVWKYSITVGYDVRLSGQAHQIKTYANDLMGDMELISRENTHLWAAASSGSDATKWSFHMNMALSSKHKRERSSLFQVKPK